MAKNTGKKTAKSSPGLEQLKQDLSSGQPGRLYILYGDESYLRARYLERLRAALLPPGTESFNLHTFDGRGITADSFPQQLSEAVDSFPLMNDRSLVLVTDFDLFKTGERDKEYLAILEDLPDYVCLIFNYVSIKPDGRSMNGKLGKAAKAAGTIVRFDPLEGSDLSDWLIRRCREEGQTLGRAEAEYLAFYCGNALSDLICEVDKLSAYAMGRPITREDIEQVCHPIPDALSFHMVDAILAGEFGRASDILSNMLNDRQSGIMILGGLGKSLRQLYTARIAMERQAGSDWVAEQYGLASWQTGRLMSNARRFPPAWYRSSLVLAADADKLLKLGGTDREVLTDLLLRLAAEASAC